MNKQQKKLNRSKYGKSRRYNKTKKQLASELNIAINTIKGLNSPSMKEIRKRDVTIKICERKNEKNVKSYEKIIEKLKKQIETE